MALQPGRIARLLAAGLAGSLAHTALMALKSWAGWLPDFQPYQDVQAMLGALIGRSVHPLVPWVLSYFNGAVVLGFAFGRLYPWLPGRNGVAKGGVFGLGVWCVMGLLFFPAIGKGLFAAGTLHGLVPTLFTLAMVLAYALVLGGAYALLFPRADRVAERQP
ncbi:MAG TPA: DUF6789 family protein [Pseudolabrys sp.]|nr:DUF6789 family protein [Pseudolabrys sp.]